jgi:transglutaminase-like putative cysteine protease
MALRSALFFQPSRTGPATARPSLTLFFLLTGGFLLTLVPHVVQFPIWLSVSIVGAMILRSFIEVSRLPLPSTAFCGFLAIVFLGLILVQFRGNIMGRDPGTAFTAGLLAIKFYELRRPREVALIIFSCQFLVMSALLYSQVLELFVYCLIMMWVLTALLLRVHTGDLPEDRLLRMLRQSGIIFLQAFPLALFLFFFFPRYTGKIGLFLDQTSIGLSDTVEPGSIARLAQNESEAMYVRFISGDVPAVAAMYWRAMVLWNYQNGAWTQGPLASSELGPEPASSPGIRIDQEITIWPHNRRWLFALDVPVTHAIDPADPLFGSELFIGNVLQLAGGKLEHRTRYRVTSSTGLADEKLTAEESEAGTQLPDVPGDQIDPQVKALADRLYGEKADEAAYIAAVLHYFRHQGFVYSTSPGIQGPDWLPVFLFKSKTGFCEHFASAFAVLMRLKNIPARLVVGYQGAEYNPYADRYTVRQANAHAWDEVWIEAKKHWVRIDPTAILNGAENGPAGSGNAGSDPGETLSIQVAHHQLTFSETHLPAWLRNSLNEAQLRREQVETNWDNLVFSYDPETQSRLAQAFGLGEKARLALLVLCLIAAGICVIVFQRWMARKPPVSPVEKLYAAFCRNMAQRGIPRSNWEGPLAYTDRVAEAFPDDKPAIQRVGSIVSRARYGASPVDPAAPENLQALLTLITASQAASTSRERS